MIAGHYIHETYIYDSQNNKHHLYSYDRYNLFIASFTSEGVFNWAENAGKTFRHDHFGLLRMQVDEHNQLFVAGQINVPSKLGKHDLKIKGEKGWNSPGWKEHVDYGRYPDAYLAALDIGRLESPIFALNDSLLVDNHDALKDTYQQVPIPYTGESLELSLIHI